MTPRTTKALRIGIALATSIAAFVFSFVVFIICYIEWAVHRYPQNNSMAGFAAFMYGLPIAFVVAICVFVLALVRLKTKPA